jgi:hypothetical protein
LRGAVGTAAGLDLSGVFWPDAASSSMFELAGELPLLREGSPGGGPVPLAVLVDPPRGRPPRLGYERAVHALLNTVGLSPARYAIATDLPTTGPTSPFTLPFNVAFVGRGIGGFRRFVAELLSGLTRPEREEAISVASPGVAELAHDARQFDIIVTETDGLASLASSQPGPRLVIVQGLRGAAGQDQLRTLLPAGTSMVGIPREMREESLPMVERILRGLTHDWALHEAVAAAGRDIGLTTGQRERIRVLTSTAGLDALRLSSAFEAVERSHTDLLRLRGIERIELPVMPSVMPSAVDLRLITRAIEQGRRVDQDFRRESAGMSEMARARVAQQRASAGLAAIGELATRLSGMPELDRLAADQKRRATIWFGHDHADWDPNRTLEPTRSTVFARRRRYTLNVGIGIDWPTDLVSDDAPALDPILPPTDDKSHRLRVAAFSDRVRILSEPSQPLDLPKVGPAGPAQFVVEMPGRVRSARLRVALYYRRHVLQIFDIDLQLDAAERVVDGTAVQVTLAFSRLAQIREVERLPARSLAVATNATARGTHRFMFDEGADVSMSERLTDDAQKRVRTALADGFKRFDPKRGLPKRTFDEVIKSLAQVGAELWDHLDTNATAELSDRFNELRTADRRVLQVVRLHPEFAFPLAILYDWTLPPSVDAIDSAPVCTGTLGDGEACRCGPTSADTVCVRGFWGVRHVIEEIVREQDAQDHVATIAPAGKAAPVLCTVGAQGDDQWSQGMLDDLGNALGPDRCERLAAGSSLYARMWDEVQRPAVLVVVGHLTAKKVGAEPAGPRIYIDASEGWIAPRALNDARRDRGRWAPPSRSIVLLLGCDSAQDALGGVHNFVARLASIGAAAVIATEEKIDTSLAASLSTAVVTSLVDTGPGESLRRWRADLLTRGNPFGFLFTCFGNVDTVVPALAPEVPAAPVTAS